MFETKAQIRVWIRAAISAAFFAHWLCTQVANGDPLNLELNLPSNQLMFSIARAETSQTKLQMSRTSTPSEHGSQWSERTSYPLNIVRIKANRTLRIRGWQLKENVFFGQAKVANQWGIGLLINKRTYQYGINNRGIAFLKKF